MVYHSKELTLKVHPNGIIEINTNENFKDASYSVEAVEENLAVLAKAVAEKKRATLFHFPDVYIKKELLKVYANADIQTVASALLAKSFAAKFVGNLFLSLRGRLNINPEQKKRPIKVFTNQEMATKWLLECIANAK